MALILGFGSDPSPIAPPTVPLVEEDWPGDDLAAEPSEILDVVCAHAHVRRPPSGRHDRGLPPLEFLMSIFFLFRRRGGIFGLPETRTLMTFRSLRSERSMSAYSISGPRVTLFLSLLSEGIRAICFLMAYASSQSARS